MTFSLARFESLTGWRRIATAAGLGALACLALPPFHAVPVLVPAFTGLVLLTGAAKSWRGAAVAGWWFGFGFFISGLYWMAHAFVVAGTAEWAAPFAVVGAAAACAVFVAAACAVTRLAAARPGPRVVAFAVAWTALEWLRSFAVLGGFPWNLIGYAWAGSVAVSQAAAAAGIFGLSFVTVLTMASPAVVVAGDRRVPARGARAWWPVAVSAVVIAGLWGAGAARLADAPRADVPGVRLALVQANIAQHHKWREDLRAAHFARHLEMSAALADGDGPPVTHVIWPETAAPFVIALDRTRRRAVGAVAPPGGLVITGAIRSTPRGEDPLRIWNSLHAIDGNGDLAATYDKARLVPFGEYMPLRGLLPFDKLTDGGTDYSRGPGRVTWHLSGLPPVSPLICYEAVFPGRVIDRDDPPAWLLNVTNDGWYGLTTGPYQHLAQSRLRAVEDGLPLVRAANTGISAVFDGHGRVVASLGLAETGALTAPLPQALSSPTLYRRLGDWPLLVAGLLMVGGLWRLRR